MGSSSLPFVSFAGLFFLSTFLSVFSTPRTAVELKAMHEVWMAKYGKSYESTAEKERRFEVFKDNLRYIDEQNARNLSYKLGLNHFSDLTNEEFQSWGTCTGSNDLRKPSPLAYCRVIDLDVAPEALPPTVDWRNYEHGSAVTEIKNQGGCGGCWAFAAAAAVEGIHQIVTGDLVNVSVQQMLDCVDPTHTKSGCCGGRSFWAYNYTKVNGGIDIEENYPFQLEDQPCKTDAPKRVKIDGCKLIPPNNETELQIAVARQPVSVSIDIRNLKGYKAYEGGIYDGDCGNKPNHDVVVVGYGSEGGKDYWIIKNSYGKEWGESGYLRLLRNVGHKQGKCGIVSSNNSYPVIKSKKLSPPTFQLPIPLLKSQ